MNVVIITCIITALSGVGAAIVEAFMFRNLMVRQQLEHEQEMNAMKKQIRNVLTEKASQPRMLALQNLKSELVAIRSQIIESSRDRDYEKKLKSAYYEILHLHTFRGFCATIDGRLYGYMSRVQSLYPSLSEQQYVLLLLYLLDLSNEDIAIVMNYQINSLPNTKIRLAHKINLSSGLLIQPHLVEIYCETEETMG